MENLTTYTEVDANGRITISSTACTVAGLARQTEESYVYKDKTANFFNENFQHNFEFAITSADLNGGYQLWQLANVVDDRRWFVDNAADWLGIMFFRTAADVERLELWEGGVEEGQFATVYNGIAIDGTVYYCTVRRDESDGTYGTLYLDLYSDSGRTDLALITTISLALHVKNDFRYIYVCSADNDSSVATVSGYTRNFDLSTFKVTVQETITLAETVVAAIGAKVFTVLIQESLALAETISASLKKTWSWAAKNTASWTGQTKHTSNWTNKTKNNSNWDFEDKS